MRKSMKTINTTFEDAEFQQLREIKGEKSWKKFILGLLDKKKK